MFLASLPVATVRAGSSQATICSLLKTYSPRSCCLLWALSPLVLDLSSLSLLPGLDRSCIADATMLRLAERARNPPVSSVHITTPKCSQGGALFPVTELCFDYFEQKEIFQQKMREPTATARDWVTRLGIPGCPKASAGQMWDAAMPSCRKGCMNTLPPDDQLPVLSHVLSGA